MRDSRVTSYSGQYEAYVYKVHKEIEDGDAKTDHDQCTSGICKGRPIGLLVVESIAPAIDRDQRQGGPALP